MGNSSVVGVLGASCVTNESTCRDAVGEGCFCEELDAEPPYALDQLKAAAWKTSTGGEESGQHYVPHQPSSSSSSSAFPDEEHQDDPRTAGIRSIVQAMSGFLEDPLVQTRGCKSLISIARQPQFEEKVVAAGAIEAAVAAVKAHPKDVELQVAACTVLESLASTSDSQQRLLAAGGADAIILSMGNHPDVLAIQRAGCQTLVNVPLILEDPKFTTTQAVVGVILSAMQLHPYDCGVQESGCGILWCTALHEAGQDLVVQQNGVGAAIAAMRTFPNEVTLQRLGTGLLLHIVSSRHSQAAVHEAGGLAAVVHAVQLHASDVRVYRRACGVLAFLATSGNSTELAQAGATSALLGGLAFHPEQALVQEGACEALLLLLSLKPLGVREAEAAAAMQEFVSVLGVLASEAKVQSLGLQCLRCLLRAYPQQVGTSAFLQASKAANLALQLHPHEPGVQEAGRFIVESAMLSQEQATSSAANSSLSAASSQEPATGSLRPTELASGPPAPGPAALAAAEMAAALSQLSPPGYNPTPMPAFTPEARPGKVAKTIEMLDPNGDSKPDNAEIGASDGKVQVDGPGAASDSLAAYLPSGKEVIQASCSATAPQELAAVGTPGQQQEGEGTSNNSCLSVPLRPTDALPQPPDPDPNPPRPRESQKREDQAEVKLQAEMQDFEM